MFLPSDRSYMRLTEKEHETLPIDVSNFYPYFQPSSWFQILFFFFLFVLPSVFLLCVSRLYCRLCCHLSWPVTVLSTSLESSKIWMLPQSWKTSKLTSPWHTSTPSAVQLFFVLCHRGSSWLTTSATFIVILLWSCSPRIPQMQLYITQLVCWKPPKTENVFKAKPKNGAYTWK